MWSFLSKLCQLTSSGNISWIDLSIFSVISTQAPNSSNVCRHKRQWTSLSCQWLSLKLLMLSVKSTFMFYFPKLRNFDLFTLRWLSTQLEQPGEGLSSRHNIFLKRETWIRNKTWLWRIYWWNVSDTFKDTLTFERPTVATSSFQLFWLRSCHHCALSDSGVKSTFRWIFFAVNAAHHRQHSNFDMILASKSSPLQKSAGRRSYNSNLPGEGKSQTMPAVKVQRILQTRRESIRANHCPRGEELVRSLADDISVSHQLHQRRRLLQSSGSLSQGRSTFEEVRKRDHEHGAHRLKIRGHHAAAQNKNV